MTLPGIRGVGEIVREYRQQTGLTQRRLAEEAGVSFWMIREIEQGRRGIGTQTLRRLGTRLGTSFLKEVATRRP